MLRVTTIDGAAGRVALKLEGRVMGEWVGVLRDACEADGGQLTLDLSSVRFVSREGVALLRELRGRGVSLASPSPFLRVLLSD